MSETERPNTNPDREMIESVWAEAREMVKRLEGSTVQRFAVAAGEYKIEIERGAPPPVLVAEDAGDAVAGAASGQRLATSAGPGPGIDAGARNASGVFTIEQVADNRVPVLAPLVGTFYRAPKPGEKPFVEIGDTVDAGQTVCIVEAMKMMNEVVAAEAGKVAEIAAEDGKWVEFDEPLMYLESPEA